MRAFYRQLVGESDDDSRALADLVLYMTMYT